MAALFAILTALLRSASRSLRDVSAITGNNVIAIIALLMANEPADRPSSTAVFYLVIGLLYTVPLALELERRIPKERLELWPLSVTQRILLTAAGLLLNPVFVLAVLFAVLSRHPAVGGALLISGALAPPFVFAATRILRGANVQMPRLPMLPGRLGGLALNHLREMLQSLDVPFAVALSIGGIVYRVASPQPDPAAAQVIGGFIVMLLSTVAQPSGGFDAAASADRMRLMPLARIDLLLARDFAWLLLALALIATYPLVPCLSAALIALAVGHATARQHPIEQKRWHFAAGHLGPTGLFQLIAIAVTAAAAVNFGAPVLALAVATYAAFTWWFGRHIPKNRA